MRHHNEIRPHSSLNYRTPAEFITGLKNDLSIETNEIGPKKPGRSVAATTPTSTGHLNN
jgi:hypothetical protein